MGMMELLQGFFSKIFKKNLFEQVLAIMTKMRMMAGVLVGGLLVILEKFFAKFLAHPKVVLLEATIMIMMEMTSR